MTRVCIKCVMDSSDPKIRFDQQGVCSHCHEYDSRIANLDRVLAGGPRFLERQISEIRLRGKGRQFDCLLGVSGGFDSSYLAVLAHRCGLRPLALHVDNGWDSELSVRNVQRLIDTLRLPYVSEVIDWDEFSKIQLSFLRAGVPDVEIPTDHVILASMRNVAERYGITTILCGSHLRTESHLPAAWSQGHSDWWYIEKVCRRFGGFTPVTVPHYTPFRLAALSRKQHWIDFLNFFEFDKLAEKPRLAAEIGWKDYGGKHWESVFTRFFQAVYLPEKFGYDKRKAHLSSMICSGTITRDHALSILEQPPCSFEQRADDIRYCAKKFSISEHELESLIGGPKRYYNSLGSRRYKYLLSARKTLGPLHHLFLKKKR